MFSTLKWTDTMVWTWAASSASTATSSINDILIAPKLQQKVGEIFENFKVLCRCRFISILKDGAHAFCSLLLIVRSRCLMWLSLELSQIFFELLRDLCKEILLNTKLVWEPVSIDNYARVSSKQKLEFWLLRKSKSSYLWIQ